jgi:crossover junction endonuclease MUS81
MSKSASGIGHLNSSSQATSGPHLNYSGMPSISSRSTKPLSDIPSLRAKSGQDAIKITLSDENAPKELDNTEHNISEARMPPVTRFSSFESRYDVVLLVDEREQYSRNQSGSLSRALSAQKYVERMRQSGCKVERRCLPVGDALWVARNKQMPGCEYVLDYVLERKSLDDLIQSIRSSDRYKNQKYRLKRCGLQNIFYLVEGEVESLPSASEHKTVCTACAKTNVIDGFRVIRTKNVTETLRLYSDMTLGIIDLYSKAYSKAANSSTPVTATGCQAFQEFSKRCTDIDKGMTTLQDIWVMMLCEIPGLGPEVACAIARHYPTPRALWNAYSSKTNLKTCSAKENPDTMLASISLGSGYRKVGVECSRKVFSSLFFK